MYRISREGRRTSNGDLPDTPPRGMRRLRGGSKTWPPLGAATAASNWASRNNKFGMGDGRMKLGAKVMAALFALLLVYRIHQRTCPEDTEGFAVSRLALLEKQLSAETQSRRAAENHLADLKANGLAKAGMPGSGSNGQLRRAEAEAEEEMEEDLEITLDHHQGIDRDDLQKLVDEKKVELDITRDELDSFKQKNEDLKKELEALQEQMDAASDILRDRQVLRVDSAAGISKGDEESEDEDGATGPESSHSDESGAVGEANASADSGHYSEDAGAGSEGENEGQEIGEKEGGKAPTSESHSQPVTRKKFGKTVHLEDNAADPEVDHEKFLFEETTNFAQFDANDQEAVWGRQEAIEKGVERVDWHGPSVSDVLEEVKLDPLETSDAHFRDPMQEIASDNGVREEEEVGLVDNDFKFETSGSAAEKDPLLKIQNTVAAGDNQEGNPEEQGDGKAKSSSESSSQELLPAENYGDEGEGDEGGAWKVPQAVLLSLSAEDEDVHPNRKKAKRAFLRGTRRNEEFGNSSTAADKKKKEEEVGEVFDGDVDVDGNVDADAERGVDVERQPSHGIGEDSNEGVKRLGRLPAEAEANEMPDGQEPRVEQEERENRQETESKVEPAGISNGSEQSAPDAAANVTSSKRGESRDGAAVVTVASPNNENEVEVVGQGALDEGKTALTETDVELAVAKDEGPPASEGGGEPDEVQAPVVLPVVKMVKEGQEQGTGWDEMTRLAVEGQQEEAEQLEGEAEEQEHAEQSEHDVIFTDAAGRLQDPGAMPDASEIETVPHIEEGAAEQQEHDTFVATNAAPRAAGPQVQSAIPDLDVGVEAIAQAASPDAQAPLIGFGASNSEGVVPSLLDDAGAVDSVGVGEVEGEGGGTAGELEVLGTERDTTREQQLRIEELEKMAAEAKHEALVAREEVARLMEKVALEAPTDTSDVDDSDDDGDGDVDDNSEVFDSIFSGRQPDGGAEGEEKREVDGISMRRHSSAQSPSEDDDLDAVDDEGMYRKAENKIKLLEIVPQEVQDERDEETKQHLARLAAETR